MISVLCMEVIAIYFESSISFTSPKDSINSAPGSCCN